MHILYTGCAKIKKNNSGAKRLINARLCTYKERSPVDVQTPNTLVPDRPQHEQPPPCVVAL